MEKLKHRLQSEVYAVLYEGMYSDDEIADKKMVHRMKKTTDIIADKVVDEVSEYQVSLLDSLEVMYNCLKEYPVPSGDPAADAAYENQWRKKWERAWKMVHKVKKEVSSV